MSCFFVVYFKKICYNKDVLRESGLEKVHFLVYFYKEDIMIEKRVRELISEEVSKLGITIDDIIYEKEGSNYFLRVIIDREVPIDIDTCVKVTKVINPILDNSDIIDKIDALEVWSKEKGE